VPDLTDRYQVLAWEAYNFTSSIFTPFLWWRVFKQKRKLGPRQIK
jgi:hypothetical protein